jgi:predicted transcriptional regulator
VTDQLASGGTQPNLAELTADIVSAFVANNSVRPSDLPELISSIHAALTGVGSPAAKQDPEKPTPAVNPKKSITPDYLISLEDGKRYKSMKRHLTLRGLTPEQYREKWGLPRDYPMVAPNYAKARSELAKKMQLGQQRKKSAQAKAAASSERVSGDAPKKRAHKTPA